MRHFSKASKTAKYRISAPIMVNDRVYPHWQRDSDSWTQSTKCNSTELATYDSTNALAPHAPAGQHESEYHRYTRIHVVTSIAVTFILHNI